MDTAPERLRVGNIAKGQHPRGSPPRVMARGAPLLGVSFRRMSSGDCTIFGQMPVDALHVVHSTRFRVCLFFDDSEFYRKRTTNLVL